jgi:hypothetical protein
MKIMAYNLESKYSHKTKADDETEDDENWN